VAVNESKAFRVKRAADNVVRLAREWSVAYHAWSTFDGDSRRDDELFDAQKALHRRLEAAAHELVAVEADQ
jgi:hypothetical protein